MRWQRQSYDAYRSAYEMAKANLAVGEAQFSSARKTAAHCRGNPAATQRNLGYCTIKSTGQRCPSIRSQGGTSGQTVVASLNAPSLFLIAKDLKRMQVWVSVNEAISAPFTRCQPVTISSVDAYPGQGIPRAKGEGKITSPHGPRSRNGRNENENGVTYTSVTSISHDNSSGRLLPISSQERTV